MNAMVLAPEKKTTRKPAQDFLALALPSDFSDDQLFEFCRLNENYRFECNSNREIMVMPLTGGKTGIRNAELTAEIGIWNRQKKGGQVFDSSTGFRLPNGATYSPDTAWIANERWKNLTSEQQEKFVPIVPDFICELLSSNKERSHVQSKMEEFADNGCRLGWLIDPFKKTTWVYRPKVEVEKVPFRQTLFGGQVLEGFQMNAKDILPA